MDLWHAPRDLYLEFAREADDSPCFSDWARRVADDEAVLQWIETLPPLKQQPNLVFAAARWHGVEAPGPYEGLRAALLGALEPEIRATILQRSTQTNEAGRLSTLVPAFAQVADRAPLALLEIGASAGLCLYPDRWSYRWTTADGDVVAGDGPEQGCRASGPAPLPAASPTVSWRGGIDLNPLDVTDRDEMDWLTNLIWPEHADRRERLLQAIEIARTDPPHLRRADLLTELPDLVEEAGRHGTVVVFHSAVAVYLTPEDRRSLDTMMRGLLADGRCHWVSNEGASVLPSVAAGLPAPEHPADFALGIDGTGVAWAHGHGRSLSWATPPGPART